MIYVANIIFANLRTSSKNKIIEHLGKRLQFKECYAHVCFEINVNRKQNMVEEIFTHFQKITHHRYLKIFSTLIFYKSSFRYFTRLKNDYSCYIINN